MNFAEFNRNLSISGINRANTAIEGTNGKMGVATLAAGAATINNTSVTANSRIFLTAQSGTLNIGTVGVTTRVPGTSFSISSTNALDTRQIAYQIFDAA